MKLLLTLVLNGLLLLPGLACAADWKDILAEKNWEALMPDIKWRDYLPGARGEPGVVATVNGVPIEFRQVEGLYDMDRAIHGQGGYEKDLPGLRRAYAEHLLELITQTLIRQELQARKLGVEDAKVAELESMIREGYSEGELERVMTLDGIQPALWREQLRARLELELFEATVLKNAEFTPEDMEQWRTEHPGAGSVPETWSLVLVQAEKREQAEAARKAGIKNAQEAAAMTDLGLSVSTARLTRTALPQPWEKDILNMNPGQFTQVRPLDDSFAYVVLQEKKKAETLNPLALYAYMEDILRRQAREKAFDIWLEQTLAKADIRIARPLLPGLQAPAGKPQAEAAADRSAGATARAGNANNTAGR